MVRAVASPPVSSGSKTPVTPPSETSPKTSVSVSGVPPASRSISIRMVCCPPSARVSMSGIAVSAKFGALSPVVVPLEETPIEPPVPDEVARSPAPRRSPASPSAGVPVPAPPLVVESGRYSWWWGRFQCLQRVFRWSLCRSRCCTRRQEAEGRRWPSSELSSLIQDPLLSRLTPSPLECRQPATQCKFPEHPGNPRGPCVI